jgi:TolA-binding protein
MRSTLLAVAIAAGLGVTSFAAVAAPQKASTKVTVSASELADMRAQIAALSAKVEELETKSDAQTDAQVATSQSVADVQTKVATAKPSDDLTKRLDKLDKLVSNTKVGGTMFFDITDADHHEQVGTAANRKVDGHGSVNGTGFDVKRFYLTIDHQFDDIWSANLTTDFNYASAISQTSLFVKKAYVQAKLDPLFTVRVGAADMPWIPFVEKWYGYRFLENTITDRSMEGGRSGATATAGGVGAFGNSSDWGVHALGATTGDNSVNYQLSVVNGRGYKNLTRSDGVDTEARFGYSPVEQMVIAVGGYEGKRGNDVQNGAPTRDATRGDAMIAWRDSNFGIGGEYFTAKNWDDVLKYQGTGAVPLAISDKAHGYSAWADYKFAPGWAVFARYDKLDYKYTTVLNADRSLNDKYYNAGVSYDFLKNLRLALAYKHNQLDGPVAAYTYKTNELGFWGMLTF